MRIRALSVFEGIVYHCYATELANPCRPTLEVEAVTREGDLDAGPLLVAVADYIRMVGVEVARECLKELEAKGRVVHVHDVAHISFPTWSSVS